jgi:hypothetical protein
VTAPPHRALTPRRATGLVLRRPAQRTPEAQERLAPLTGQDAELAAAIALAHDCAPLVRQRPPAPRDPWLARAATRALVPLQRCAKGLRDDDNAVNAGVSRSWSKGPVEGHIKRVQTLSRQMCGRASLDRLQRRFVLAASGQRSRQNRVSGRYRAMRREHTCGLLSTGSLCRDRGRSARGRNNGSHVSAHASPKVAMSPFLVRVSFFWNLTVACIPLGFVAFPERFMPLLRAGQIRIRSISSRVMASLVRS